MDTLKDYLVLYNHLNIQEPDSELGKELFNLMCLDPVEGLKNFIVVGSMNSH